MARTLNLVEKLMIYNEAYRKGMPIVSDTEYDSLLEELRKLDPNHPYLNEVEPEIFSGKVRVRHPLPMLSTEKAYSTDQLKRFIARVEKQARDIGIQTVSFEVTPKLDGLAGRDDGRVFASRGDGKEGYEITNAFSKGVVPVGGRGLGSGEIVISKSYFEKHLKDKFEHPRNMVVGIIASDTVNEVSQKALATGVVKFVPYQTLEKRICSATDLLTNLRQITQELFQKTDYPMDGLIVSALGDTLRSYMGATSHHYRWQIAMKEKGETAITTVESITWQIGRTGNVTPVLEVIPISLSGATIRRVTAHHAGLVKSKKLGKGAQILVIRSGEVIPKIEFVEKPAETVEIPTHCPSCEAELIWEGDFLKCPNLYCRAQVEQGIAHWFKILGNSDGFGIETVRKLVQAGFDTLEKVYRLTEENLLQIGFGVVQSKNLIEALDISRKKNIEDWRFLAAFGISDLGVGDSRNLLGHFPIETITNVLSKEIVDIEGFGEITSRTIITGLQRKKETILYMLELGFSLEKTPLNHEIAKTAGPLFQKEIVFTGKMVFPREEMEKNARLMGAKIQKAISSKTNYLVCGENVGATKLTKATKLGVTILTEMEYQKLIEEN